MFKNRKLLTIIIILGIALLLAGAWRLSQSSSKSTSPSPSPTTKSAEAELKGDDVLIARGVSSAQIEDLNFALYTFFKASNQQVKTVTITNVKHLHYPPPTPHDAQTFVITLDTNTVYNARIDYSDTTSIRLTLTDPKTGKAVHDSGIVKVTGDKD